MIDGARTRYVIHLEARLRLEEADYQLRRALKRLWRAYGLRCLHVALDRETPPAPTLCAQCGASADVRLDPEGAVALCPSCWRRAR